MEITTGSGQELGPQGLLQTEGQTWGSPSRVSGGHLRPRPSLPRGCACWGCGLSDRASGGPRETPDSALNIKRGHGEQALESPHTPDPSRGSELPAEVQGQIQDKGR